MTKEEIEATANIHGQKVGEHWEFSPWALAAFAHALLGASAAAQEKRIAVLERCLFQMQNAAIALAAASGKMRDELKPCPFCAGKAEFGATEDGGNFIECTGCGSSTSLRYSLMDDARPILVESWNRRAQLAAPIAQEPVAIRGCFDGAWYYGPWVAGANITPEWEPLYAQPAQ